MITKRRKESRAVLEALHYAFIQKALLAGAFISVLCAVLGVFLVLKKFSLIGDGLSHVTFFSIALGLFFKTSPLYVSVPVVAVSSLGILKLTEKGKVFGDTAIGIVSSLGIAGGIIIASLSGGFNVDLMSYLFGSILTIQWAEVALSVALSALVIALVIFYYHDLVAATFDEESAKVMGINTGRVNKVLVLLTSLTVVLSMRIVGIMLVSSFLIIPAASALQLGLSFRSTILAAAAFGFVSVISGIFISYAADLPAGAAIVMVSFILFCAAFGLRKVTGK